MLRAEGVVGERATDLEELAAAHTGAVQDGDDCQEAGALVRVVDVQANPGKGLADEGRAEGDASHEAMGQGRVVELLPAVDHEPQLWGADGVDKGKKRKMLAHEVGDVRDVRCDGAGQEVAPRDAATHGAGERREGGRNGDGVYARAHGEEGCRNGIICGEGGEGGAAAAVRASAARCEVVLDGERPC